MTQSIHVLYEYGPDLRPHGSAHIRLLRPLSHPALQDAFQVTFARDYHGEAVSAVLVDRLWRPDVDLLLVESLVDRVREAGARLIYALDDDFLTLDLRRAPWFREEHRTVAQYLLCSADKVVVTTAELGRRLSKYNQRISVLPNALDERLLLGGIGATPFEEDRIVIGYMGTLSHDEDLLLTLPALQSLARAHAGRIELQIVGGMTHPDTLRKFSDLRLRVLLPGPGEAEYPLFMLWFTGRLRWDIALAPLVAADFNACKSDIKFLDYAAAGVPGVYSRVPAYIHSVRHRETGLLVENTPDSWRDALESLILDRELRGRLATNARGYLYSERVLAKCASDWLTALD